MLKNSIWPYRLVLAGSLGVGYYIYRNFLWITMLNQNTIFNDSQITDMKLRNFAYGQGQNVIGGHYVNSINTLNEKPKVLIIGAGVIGIIQSLKLLENGYSVILVDKGAQAAMETSYYNGCVFTPLSPKTLINPQSILSAFYFWKEKTTSLSIDFFLQKYWFIFSINTLLLACTNQKALQNAEKQIKLGRISLKEADRLHKRGLFEYKVKGQIGLFHDEDKKKAFTDLLDHHQVDYKDIDNPDILQKYPDLKSSFQFITENGIDTFSLSQKVLQYCQSKYPKYFTFIPKTNVKNFVLDGRNNCIGATTGQGVILSDKFIISCAHHSKYLTDKFGIRLPIMPVKGWCIGVDQNEDYSIYNPYYLQTTIDGQLRLSGCAEIGTDKRSEDPSKDWGAQYILKYFNKYNPNAKIINVHSCARPVMADDLPVISQIYKNVYLSTGHGSKGLSYSFGSAEVLYQIMQGEQYQDFSISRFYLV